MSRFRTIGDIQPLAGCLSRRSSVGLIWFGLVSVFLHVTSFCIQFRTPGVCGPPLHGLLLWPDVGNNISLSRPMVANITCRGVRTPRTPCRRLSDQPHPSVRSEINYSCPKPTRSYGNQHRFLPVCAIGLTGDRGRQKAAVGLYCWRTLHAGSRRRPACMLNVHRAAAALCGCTQAPNRMVTALSHVPCIEQAGHKQHM